MAYRVDDEAYKHDTEALEAIRLARPWKDSPHHFKKTRISTIASMKMLQHALYGVEQGRKTSATGSPIEIMGLCVGHIDAKDPSAFVLTDAFPLPIEGSEYNVVGDTDEFMKYQSQLVNFWSDTRKDSMLAWYHSHPFDVKKHSNCFFSMTDVMQQRNLQMATEMNDFSFVGIVIDPLRSISKGRPEIGAFRTFPGGYNQGKLVAPDGVKHADEASITERWGNAYLSYASLEVEFFSSSLADRMLGMLSRDFLWQRTLSAAPGRDPEAIESTATRLQTVAASVKGAARSMSHVSRGSADAVASMSGGGAVSNPQLSEACATSAQLASEQARFQASQLTKHELFNASSAPAAGAKSAAGTASESKQ